METFKRPLGINLQMKMIPKGKFFICQRLLLLHKPEHGKVPTSVATRNIFSVATRNMFQVRSDINEGFFAHIDITAYSQLSEGLCFLFDSCPSP